jgi:hypothetical protein
VPGAHDGAGGASTGLVGSAIYAGRARRHAVWNGNRKGSVVTREGEQEGPEPCRSRAAWPLAVLDGLALPARCAPSGPAGPGRTGLLGWLRG